MKKSELIAALSAHDDDAHLMIKLDGEEYEILMIEHTWDVDDDQNIVDAKNMAFIVGAI